MKRPLVTVGVSTYNRADGYLREALASALAQTYEPLEIVISDNASTDATGDVVAEMADERVRYVRLEKNVGANGNFNSCLQLAKGEYFLLLHDDDRIDADMVERCMAALERSGAAAPPGLIRTGTRVIDAEGSVTSERRNEARSESLADLMTSWFDGETSMYFCNTIFRTEVLRDAGGFTTPREQYIDVAAVIRIAARHEVLDVPDVLASFRRHGGNTGTAQSIEAWCEDSLYLIDLMCELAPERADELRRRGLHYFSRNNYNRVARFRGISNRALAYWVVYKSFDFRASPLTFIAYKNYLRFKRSRRRTN
ncbi:MAG: glycosyltransferase [Trueperaceae bacterium]|nr:glycosyltransferase [Trueperaceae bacterium]